MNGTPVKNHGKKPQGFPKKAKANSCEITRKSIKNIPCQVEPKRAWWKDEKKNWKQFVNTDNTGYDWESIVSTPCGWEYPTIKSTSELQKLFEVIGLVLSLHSNMTLWCLINIWQNLS